MIFEELRAFPATLSSIQDVCVLGCGRGHDAVRISDMMDLHGRPYPFRVVALDEEDVFETRYRRIRNLSFGKQNWTDGAIGVDDRFDAVYTDKLQTSYQPFSTIFAINTIMREGGILCVDVPAAADPAYGRPHNHTISGEPHTFTTTMLIYLLACGGFKVEHVRNEKDDPSIQAIAYRQTPPPYRSTWYDLAAAGLLTLNMTENIMKHGYLDSENLVLEWIDGRNTLA